MRAGTGTGAGVRWGGSAPTSAASGTGAGGGVTLPGAWNGKQKAEAALGDALGTTRDALDSARGAAARAGARISNTEGDVDAARRAAQGVGTAITNINAAASRLNPYERVFAGQGMNLLSAYDALIRGDPSVGGMLGDYLGATRDAAAALEAINPDNYAAMAGADVQANFDNTRGQNLRELARRGVSAGSGASMAPNDRFNRALATARAAAMMRARMQGVSDRANAQMQKQGLFKGVIDQANTQSDKGLASIGEASNIVQKQGDLFSIAGNLGNTQTNAYATIGGMEVNLGELDLANEKLVQETIGDVEAAQQALAKFYQDTADVTETKDAFGFDDDVITTRRYS